MIENLNGIHETVEYKENSNAKLFINAEAEDYPIHWHTPMGMIWYILMRVILSL